METGKGAWLGALLPALGMAALLAACEPSAPPVTPPAPTAAPASTADTLALPEKLRGKAVVLAATDPDYPRAELTSAVKPVGEGGISKGIVVRLTEDVPVWRMWSGAAKKDSRGNTNRMGQWWVYDAPRGSQQEYRTNHGVCVGWNDLTWVARCTLKKGAVVAVGPGQSVSAQTCGDAAGKEAYPANTRDWQTWISKVWTRGTEIECPADTADYEADPADVTHAKKSASK